MCPAGINGIVGVKPTVGLVSRDGIIPIAHSQDTAGPMARTVTDAAAMLQAMVGLDPDDPAAGTFPDTIPDYVAELTSSDLTGVRIGVMRNYSGAGTQPDVEAAFEASIQALQSAGAEVVDSVMLPDLEDMGRAEGIVLNYEFKNDIREYLQGHGSPNGMSTLADLINFNEENRETVMPFFEQERFLRAEKSGPLSDTVYLDALATGREVARRAIDGSLAEYGVDVLIAPTNGPAGITSLENGDNWSGWVGNSGLAAVSGYPSVTVPMGYSGGLPVGLSIIGGAYEEALLLRVAYGFEQSNHIRRPPEYRPGTE
jgi:amidase